MLAPIGVSRLLEINPVSLRDIIPRHGGIVVIDLRRSHQRRVLAFRLHRHIGRGLLRLAAGVSHLQLQHRHLVARQVVNPVVERRRFSYKGVLFAHRRKGEVLGTISREAPLIRRHCVFRAVGVLWSRIVSRCRLFTRGIVIIVMVNERRVIFRTRVLHKVIAPICFISVRQRHCWRERHRSVVSHHPVVQRTYSTLNNNLVVCDSHLAESSACIVCERFDTITIV